MPKINQSNLLTAYCKDGFDSHRFADNIMLRKLRSVNSFRKMKKRGPY